MVRFQDRRWPMPARASERVTSLQTNLLHLQSTERSPRGPVRCKRVYLVATGRSRATSDDAEPTHRMRGAWRLRLPRREFAPLLRRYMQCFPALRVAESKVPADRATRDTHLRHSPLRPRSPARV